MNKAFAEFCPRINRGHLQYHRMVEIMSKFLFHAVIEREAGEKEYSSLCLENNVASCGKTPQEALANLHEAVSLYVKHIIQEKRFKMLWRPAPQEEWA